MYIKLKIEGELLEQLKSESELECRTATQQCLYIIKSYYKDKVVTDSSLEVTTNNTEETQEEKNETIDIPEDVFNF